MDLIWQGLLEGVRLILERDTDLLKIIALSLTVSLAATLIATAVGVPLGVALAIGRFRGRLAAKLAVNTGMGLPPVVVGLVVAIFLWRTGPLGELRLIYTPAAMIVAQFIVATPIIAGFTWAAVELLEPALFEALRVDGAGRLAMGWELVRAALPQVAVAVAAGFGRAIAEVGASLMVGGNIKDQTRILTTALTLEVSRGDFALAIALGLVLLSLAFIVNVGIMWRSRSPLL